MAIWFDSLALSRQLDQERQYRFLPSQPRKVVATSGGFDPLHHGHTRSILAASLLGEVLVVIVNGDGFLTRKKGYHLLPSSSRAEVVHSLKGVNHVLVWDDGSQYVDGAIRLIRPDIWAKGGDRQPGNLSEAELNVCQDIGCEVVWGVGGTDKVESSSRIIERIRS